MTTAVPWVAHGTHPLCFHRKGGRGSVGDFSRLYLSVSILRRMNSFLGWIVLETVSEPLHFLAGHCASAGFQPLVPRTADSESFLHILVPQHSTLPGTRDANYDYVFTSTLTLLSTSPNSRVHSIFWLCVWEAW